MKFAEIQTRAGMLYLINPMNIQHLIGLENISIVMVSGQVIATTISRPEALTLFGISGYSRLGDEVATRVAATSMLTKVFKKNDSAKLTRVQEDYGDEVVQYVLDEEWCKDQENRAEPTAPHLLVILPLGRSMITRSHRDPDKTISKLSEARPIVVLSEEKDVERNSEEDTTSEST